MATFELPVRGDIANYDLSVELDGIIFNLEFRYNTRDSAWYFSLLDETGNKIRSGIKLVANFPLLRVLRDLRRPPGEFVSFDSRQVPAPPELAELGKEILLTYVDQSDLESLA